MPIIQVVIYQKSGATFSSAEEAYQNKNSLYSTELTESIDQCHAQMLTDNILLEPTSYAWDQEAKRLTIRRVLSNVESFESARTYDLDLASEKVIAAGWEFISAEYETV